MVSKAELTEERRIEIVDGLFQRGVDVIRKAMEESAAIVSKHQDNKTILMAAGEFSLAADTPIEVLEANFTRTVAQELLTHEADGTDFNPYQFAQRSGNHIS